MNKPILVIILFCTVLIVTAQENINTSGNEATGSGGSSSYSIGQLVYASNSGSGGTLVEGVQQSIESFTLSNPELTTVNLRVVTYPNPTKDYVVLSITDPALINLSYVLYDISSKVVSQGSMGNADTRINMQNLAPGTYILKVNQNSQALKTFKIIKK